MNGITTTARLPLAMATALAAGLVLLATAPAAQAGCGCDHPPPAWAPVMPAFGSPGRTVTLAAQDRPFEPGATYTVRFGLTRAPDVVAEHSDVLEIVVPEGARIGPSTIWVRGPGRLHVYRRNLFTVLPPATVIPAGTSAQQLVDLRAAIAKDGTFLIPIDLSQVRDAVQIAFQMTDLALRFRADDVVFFNADGVDLTVFSLEVESSEERQWGSYYGWEVEEDRGIFGEVFEAQTIRADEPKEMSDFLTYCRHEFHTYAEAHAPGETHEVSESGFHPDGTMHIDHDHLVVAISGKKKGRTVRGSMRWVDGVMLVVETPHPIEPEQMMDLLEASVAQ